MKEGLLHLADGRELGYAEYGAPDGQPVLYCHGFPTCRLELVPSEADVGALGSSPIYRTGQRAHTERRHLLVSAGHGC